MEPTAEFVSLHQIRCFCATVDTGSFTAAAERLGLTQPAVAGHIRKLERLLGVDLFSRAARGVDLTIAGQAFAAYAPTVLDSLAQAVGAVDDTIELRSGTLAVGLSATPEAYGIDALASDFALRYPGIQLRLVGRNSSESADRVRSGELEAALVSLPVDDDQLDVRPIVDDEVVFVSADPRIAGRPIAIDELANRALVVYDAESGERDPLRRQLGERAQQQGLRLEPRIETETMIMALRMVADGVGDTYLPRAHTRAPYYPPNVHATTFRPPLHETLAIVQRQNARLSPAVTEFTAELADHLRVHVSE